MRAAANLAPPSLELFTVKIELLAPAHTLYIAAMSVQTLQNLTELLGAVQEDAVAAGCLLSASNAFVQGCGPER